MLAKQIDKLALEALDATNGDAIAAKNLIFKRLENDKPLLESVIIAALENAINYLFEKAMRDVIVPD